LGKRNKIGKKFAQKRGHAHTSGEGAQNHRGAVIPVSFFPPHAVIQ